MGLGMQQPIGVHALNIFKSLAPLKKSFVCYFLPYSTPTSTRTMGGSSLAVRTEFTTPSYSKTAHSSTVLEGSWAVTICVPTNTLRNRFVLIASIHASSWGLPVHLGTNFRLQDATRPWCP